MPNICGIDPGAFGSLALISDGGEAIWIEDMPVTRLKVGKTYRNRLEWNGLFRIERKIPPDTHIWIEKQWARPMDSPSRAAAIVGMYGALLGFMRGRNRKVFEVAPQKWKAKWPELAHDKDQSVYLAEQLFPSQKFRTPRGRLLDGRSDAVLIAEFGRTYKPKCDSNGAAIVALLRSGKCKGYNVPKD